MLLALLAADPTPAPQYVIELGQALAISTPIGAGITGGIVAFGKMLFGYLTKRDADFSALATSLVTRMEVLGEKLMTKMDSSEKTSRAEVTANMQSLLALQKETVGAITTNAAATSALNQTLSPILNGQMMPARAKA